MMHRIAVALAVVLAGAELAVAGPALSPPQVTFEQTAGDLRNPDPAVRLRAVRLLKDAAYPEAAVPLAAAVVDAEDQVQLEAIAAELNIFLASRVVARTRRAVVVEVRGRVGAEAAFAGGRLGLGALEVPAEVLTALRTAMHDENGRVAIEAVYAFGALGSEPAGAARRELLAGAAPALAAALGSPDRVMRVAALRVIGRVFAWRAGDPPQVPLGDALVSLLNDKDQATQVEAMAALGAMRYERALQSLTELLAYYGRGPLAEAALDALAHIAHASTADVLLAHLSDRSGGMKSSAIEGLARIGDRQRAGAVEAAVAKERDRRVSLAGRFAAALLADGSTDPLTEALGQPALREQALGYLVEVTPGRTAALSAFAQAQGVARQTDIADVFGLAGDPAALAYIERLGQETDPGLARAIARARVRLRAAAGAR